MKRVMTPLFISCLLAAGWAQAQQSSGDIRESTDPSRAAEVEQKARSLGDTQSPSEPSGGASSSGTDSGMGAGGPSSAAPTGTEDMSGAPGASGDPNTPYGTSGTSGTEDTESEAGSSGGGGLKSGPEAGEMEGTQQLEMPADRRFSEPTQPAR